jgi:hypothetical protein
MVRSKSNVKYYAKQIKHIIMRKDVVYLGMIWCNDIMSLNTSDEGYNNGKKCGQKGAICGPNNLSFPPPSPSPGYCSPLLFASLLAPSLPHSFSSLLCFLSTLGIPPL